jgi:hypothetical protein
VVPTHGFMTFCAHAAHPLSQTAPPFRYLFLSGSPPPPPPTLHHPPPTPPPYTHPYTPTLSVFRPLGGPTHSVPCMMWIALGLHRPPPPTTYGRHPLSGLTRSHTLVPCPTYGHEVPPPSPPPSPPAHLGLYLERVSALCALCTCSLCGVCCVHLLSLCCVLCVGKGVVAAAAAAAAAAAVVAVVFVVWRSMCLFFHTETCVCGCALSAARCAAGAGRLFPLVWCTGTAHSAPASRAVCALRLWGRSHGASQVPRPRLLQSWGGGKQR